MPDQATAVTATVLDDNVTFSLAQLCELLGLDRDDLVACVQEGLVEPRGIQPQTWSFPGQALKRLHQALRLKQDLEIDLGGAILAVELLEEAERLRMRIRTLEMLLGTGR